MPYIGKSPEMGVRTRYYYTVSAGATSVSGNDDNSKSLTFSDGEFVDVSLNGVALVAGTDYNTTTANTIAGLSAMSANDVVEVIVYDVFSVFSGDVSGDLAVGGNLTGADGGALTVGVATTVTGALSAPSLAVDTITIDGSEIDASSNLTIDSGGYVLVDTTTGLYIDQAGAGIGLISNDSGNNHLQIRAIQANKDIQFVTNSGGNVANKMTISSGGDIDVELGDIFFSTAGKGIVLGATSNTDANTLDDYEEGTWTPGQGSGLTVNGSFSSSGKYTKIGRMVYIRGKVAGSTNIAFAKSTGNELTKDLPFSGQPNADNGHSGSGQGDDLTDHFGLRQSLTILYPTDDISTVASISFTAMYFVS